MLGVRWGVDRIDDRRLSVLVADVLAGRDAAWSELVAMLYPHLERLVATSPSLGPLRGSEDHKRNAVTDVLAKLARNDHRALALLEPWLAAHPDKTSGDWLRIVTGNAIREYVSRQLGSDATKRWVHTLAGELTDSTPLPALRPPVTTQQTARQILDYAAEHLPVEQTRALEAWLHQAALPANGERLVRAALARLRRQFA